MLDDYQKEQAPVDPDWMIKETEPTTPPVRENPPLNPKPQTPTYPETVPQNKPVPTYPETPPVNTVPENKPPVKPDPRPIEEDPFGETPVVTPPTNPTPNPPVITPENNSVRSVYHTVQKGDTLWNISQRYDTTVDAIQKLNNMDNINIKLGQQLRVQ